jgi:ABC-2 type transport system permease protein
MSDGLTTSEIITLFTHLRWTMLRGVLRTKGAQKWAVVIGFASSIVIGTIAGAALLVAGRRTDDPTTMFVISATGITFIVVMIGVIAGVTQPVDPRVLATEPLTDRQLGLGLLAASAVGPPGLSAVLVGVGLFAGAARGPLSYIPVGLAVLAFMLTLLLVSRSTINALGLFATRFPRAGQIVVGLSSLVLYAVLQLFPRVAATLDEGQQDRVTDILAWMPPGQIGVALSVAGESPGRAMVHVGIGVIWLIPLVWVFTWTTRQLIMSVKRSEARSTRKRAGERRSLSATARWLCGTGATGALAWRGVLTRMRTPRTALETFTGAGIGLAIVLVPALTRTEAGAGAVLVGGAVQLAVLFMAGNSFGSDGPALVNELLTGVDPEVIVRAKARSVMVVAAPLAIVGPLIAAGVTGEWNYLLAGVLVGVGGLLAGTGGAMVQSTLVPVAIPEGDNPLASGDSGKGCFAGLILGGVLLALAIVTLPVALALLWALDRQSVVLVTVFAAATLGAGVLVLQGGIRYATRKWRYKEPEIYAAVVPVR